VWLNTGTSFAAITPPRDGDFINKSGLGPVGYIDGAGPHALISIEYADPNGGTPNVYVTPQIVRALRAYTTHCEPEPHVGHPHHLVAAAKRDSVHRLARRADGRPIQPPSDYHRHLLHRPDRDPRPQLPLRSRCPQHGRHESPQRRCHRPTPIGTDRLASPASIIRTG
jgi:hypothetical protein